VYDDDPIFAATGKADPLLDYYLNLNIAGRYVLRKESEALMPLSLWVNLLSRSSDDPDVLFCLIREKPSLVDMNSKRTGNAGVSHKQTKAMLVVATNKYFARQRSLRMACIA
jgi:hypothetical protein